MKYSNAYTTHLPHVRFHIDFLSDAENFLRKLYLHPEAEVSDEGYLVFNSLYVFFGEAPRLAPLAHLTCSSVSIPMERALKVGSGRFYDLVHNWRNLSYSTFFLKLLILEKSLVTKLGGRVLGAYYREFVAEVELHEGIIAKRFVAIFESCKDLKAFAALRPEALRIVAHDEQMGPFVVAVLGHGERGDITLKQLTSNFLSVLRFDNQVVPGILARLAGFDGALKLKFDPENDKLN